VCTLEYLINEEKLQLRLRFLQPGQAARFGPTRVTEVVARSQAELPQELQSPSATAGTLVVVFPAGAQHARPATRTVDSLIRLLAQRNAAGLVLQVPGHNLDPVPDGTRALANSLGLPLLLTSAPAADWEHVNENLQYQRSLFTKRHLALLRGLLNRLPAKLANPEANQRIADWLSLALEAEVLVTSAQRGILAAAPVGSAPATLAHAVISQSRGDASGHAAGNESTALHTRIVSIASGAEDETRLAIASVNSFDSAAVDLIQHAAKLLGLCDEARREHQARVEAPRSVRHAAFQLLMAGETVLAQVVYGGATKALLDTDTARVYVVDTGQQEREPTLKWCETVLAEMALVCPCPGKPRHILVLDPGQGDGRVDSVLRDMVAAHHGHLMGQSRPHPLAETSTCYMEALSAVADAARTPDRISLGGSEAKFAPLLPSNAARAWAQELMAPLLEVSPNRRINNEREQLLKTLRTALGFRHVEAADALSVHRNTVTQRLNRAGEVLGLDLRDSVSNRILVLLALDILALPVIEGGADEVAKTPDFAELVKAQPTADAVKAWAEERLRKIPGGRRETLCVWMEHNLNITETARALGLSEATIRNHTRDASLELGIDFSTKMVGLQDTDVVTVADIGLALYVLFGRPAISQPDRISS
jgi:DNA-directed RNA polymerase specialized sigma24 family protein